MFDFSILCVSMRGVMGVREIQYKKDDKYMSTEKNIITMNGQNTTIVDVLLRMACSPWFRYSFIHTMFKDNFGHLYQQFDIYENPRNITNYYIEPLGEKKFTITGARNDCTNGYYDICVNGQPLSSDDPMAGYCATAMVEMDNATTKHLRALDDLTFKHAGHYVINGFDDDFAVYYKKKLKFFISKDTKGVWYLDRPKITPTHPYHIPLSPQCVTNLLNRQAR